MMEEFVEKPSSSSAAAAAAAAGYVWATRSSRYVTLCVS